MTAGIASKNENLSASTRLKPRMRNAPIVDPDLETPGIKARDWAKPAKRVLAGASRIDQLNQ
jgi:hypothetical protein